MKVGSSMIGLQINGEDYLSVIGGAGPSSPPQPGAQYSGESYGRGYQRCNEVHMYKLKTDGQYMILGL